MLLAVKGTRSEPLLCKLRGIWVVTSKRDLETSTIDAYLIAGVFYQRVGAF